MENLTLISAKPVLTLTSTPNPRIIPTKQCFGLPLLTKNSNGSLLVSQPRSRTVLSLFTTKNSRRKASNNGVESTSTTVQETTSVGVNPQPYVPPPSQFGSPLFWIGVGVGCSAIFSIGASWLKKYAMQQAFKSMMGQMGSQNNQFSNSAFPSGSPFGFPPPSTSGPGFPYQPPTPVGQSTSSATAGYTLGQQYTSRPSTSSTAPSTVAQPQTTTSSPAASVTMDISANTPQVSEPVNDETETKTEVKQSAFVDISPEETAQTSPFESYDDTSSWKSSEAAKFTEVVQNGTATKEGTSGEWSQGTRKTGSMTVETFEKMMEDPKIQNMILPLLPQEMRDPATFKWMLQNPVYRQQLQDMLDNMGEGALDNQMMESLKNFDLNSPEVKQQFDQIGLTPEEAMSRIMANPEIAMAFQNPKIQQAIMDCSQNPMNIMKYQNDREVMDVFNKIQELFPGSPGF